MDITYFYDNDGYKVEIGAIVGFYEGHPDEDKLYKIVSMPNYADTLVLTEVTDNGGEWDTWPVRDQNVTIEVASYMVSAI